MKAQDPIIVHNVWRMWHSNESKVVERHIRSIRRL
jgi:hypothetical protein